MFQIVAINCGQPSPTNGPSPFPITSLQDKSYIPHLRDEETEVKKSVQRFGPNSASVQALTLPRIAFLLHGKGKVFVYETKKISQIM